MTASPSRFTIGDTDFLLDGEPHRIISGAMHYPRVHPDLWRERLRMARQMGLNAIETYVMWNAHEPVRGQWSAEGALDLGRFLDLVAEEGMHAIVRPGPYVCAEWHNGGLPTWLTAADEMRLRSSDPHYLEAVTTYLDRVYDIVAPRQLDRGGSVVLVQIENEYGAYGSDTAYLDALVRQARAAGITVPLTRVDQPIASMLEAGAHPALHTTGSFGSRIPERLATLRAHQPTGPLMCMEFWCGWFDRWGERHHTTAVADAAADLDALLSAGASVNIYMVHGGTNFALTAGANDEGRYLPLVTSYDYDAPISESGAPTEKYWAFREVIARHAPVPDEAPSSPPAAPAFDIPLEATGDPVPAASVARGRFAQPPTFEQLGADVSLASYATDLPDEFSGGVLDVDAVRDLAWVRVDGRPVGTLSRTLGELSLALPPGRRLELLVEDTGRVNYGIHIGEHKGIIGSPRLDGVPVGGWDVSVVDVNALGAVSRDAAVATPAEHLGTAARGTAVATPAGHPVAGPAGLRARFELDASADLHLDTAGWGKGYAWVNGFFLGRYWRRGPQRTLYVPAPVTQVGENTLVIVELETLTRPVARFVAAPDLGHEVE